MYLNKNILVPRAGGRRNLDDNRASCYIIVMTA